MTVTKTLAAIGVVCAIGPLFGACSTSPALPPPSIPCTSASIGDAMDAFAIADVSVSVDTGGDASLELVRADLARYLSTLWGGPISVGTTADNARKLNVVLSTSADAQTQTALAADKTYSIVRSGSSLTVAAHDASGLAFGAYALLESLGARFFHPKQEFVPAFSGARIPKALSITRAPSVSSRGIQFHTLHPIEYFKVFLEPGDANLADAKRVIDWLVKTGQNFLQFVLLSTVDWTTWTLHARAILDYAHLRHVTVGAAIQTWGGSSLQNNYVLVKNAANWQVEMDANLDKLLGLDWDSVDLALGEFSSTDPQSVIDWLNHAVDHVAKTKPNVLVNVQNHVGNYKDLYVQYQGKTVFFYHLPQFADARLGQNVHTLAFYDLYRNWATYAHEDFHLQHDYIFKELPTRRVKYFPESAYWISADVDVPLFLPEFVHARWTDVNTLEKEIRDQKLPPLNGHLMFSSGHEWGYWLTDYLTAKMLWQPDAPEDTFYADYGGAFGSCASEVTAGVSAFRALQTKYLFDARLMPYLQGENAVVDLGYTIGLETHAKRVEFEDVWKMTDADRATFDANVVSKLEAMAAEVKPIEDDLAARCRGSDASIKPWCDELWDGVAIVRNRARHIAHLFRSILAHANKADGQPELAKAQALTTEAAAIILRREAHYRFPDGRTTDAYFNPTVYAFGYLRPVHAQCYWHRREEQVAFLLDPTNTSHSPASSASIPSCQN